MSAPMAYSYPASYPLGYPGGGGYGGPPAPGLGHSTPAAFSFKKRFERVDWKKIASADVEGISRNLDFNALQENIMNVTFCNIENEVDTRTIDPNFMKLFKLAQLTIEYLLHSQDYLSGIVGSLEDKVKKALEQHEEAKKTAEKCREELTEVKKESHKRKKMLIAQQQIIEAGAGAYNKCPYCSKAFVNPSFLQSHMARRHTEYTGHYNSLVASQTQHPQPPPPPGQAQQQQPAALPVVETVAVQPAFADSRSSELERELREIRERLELTESQLVDERNARNRDSQLKQTEVASQEEMKRWQEDQLQLHQRDMKKMRDMFIKELKEMGEKNEAAQRALAEKHAGRSNLGTLEDDVDLEKELLQKQREQTAMLKEQLQEKINNVEEAMEQKFEAQGKQWKTKMKALARQHKEEEDRLRDALERSVAELQRERQDGGHRVAEYEQSVDEMKRLLKESRESEKKRLAEAAAAPTERIQQQERPSQPAAAPPAVAARPYYGHVDNEEEESEGEEETEAQDTETALSGTGLSDTALTGTNLTSFLGTLSMTNTPSMRLREAMKRNPGALKATRRELLDILDQELQKRGISPKSTTLDSKVFENKMDLLKSERQLKGKKNSMFFAIRQHFINELEQRAKEKYKAMRKSSQGLSAPSGGRVPKRPAAPVSRQTASAPTSPAATHEPHPVAQQPQRPKAAAAGQRQSAHAPKAAPVPAPRSGSPTGKMGGTLSSTGQTITSTGTISSGQWDTDEEEDEETTEGQDHPDGPHPAHRGPVRVPQPRPISPPKRTRFQGDEDEEDEEEEEEADDDWSDVSELDEADPRADRPTRGTAPPGPPRSASTPARAAPRATGSGKVAQLSRSIEQQLHGRGQKPVGGVNTVVTEDAVAPEVQRESNSFDDDEESISLSSTDLERPPEPKPGPRRNGTPQRPGTMASTDYSTNTYGTSVWGSSSRAASTGQHPGNMTRDTSTVSKTTASDDWDDSEMFDDLA